MNFLKHGNLSGCHAFLGASNFHWINYTRDKLISVYKNKLAVARGTKLHEYAKDSIELGQKLPKSTKTLNNYVNDAIAFGMKPEQILYYSEFCFGTADAISFSEEDKFLRIHDLKTGLIPAHMEQLMIYAALFCLEYKYRPDQIGIELRIYQNNKVTFYNPNPDEISAIMSKIVDFDQCLRSYDKENE